MLNRRYYFAILLIQRAEIDAIMTFVRVVQHMLICNTILDRTNEVSLVLVASAFCELLITIEKKVLLMTMRC